MRGFRNPRNILLESDCSFHETSGDSHTNHRPSRPPYIDRYCLDEHAKVDIRADPSPKDNISRPCSTPSESSARRVDGAAIKCGGQRLEQFLQKDHHVEYDERFSQGTTREIHTSSAPPGDYRKQFRQGIAKNVYEKSGRGQNGHDHSWQDVEKLRHRKTESRCSREKPEGTPFSCNDCMEPQCLYCWRKLRDSRGDFSFLDGFGTQDPKREPSKKSVDQFTSCYSDPNQYSSRRHIEDRSHPCENNKYKPSTCPSSCSLEEPKWTPTNTFQGNHEEREPKDQHSTTCDPLLKENERLWAPLGKGRGIGPVPGEWVPPFRKQSVEYPTPGFQRSKGTGAIPNLDDWVPPFRGDEQPYNWHRCKGSGGCPPRDQWLAPWCNSIKMKEQADQVYGHRPGNSC